MERISKETYLNEAREKVLDVQGKISIGIEKLKKLVNTKISGAKVEDSWTNAQVKSMNEYRLGQLELLRNSPFFNRCKINFNNESKIYYFAKFTFPEESIYSWVAPVASIRFDNPGGTSYTLPNGQKRAGTLEEKDYYQIIDGKILFFSKESIGRERELIYQEHFSQKPGFILPEIVSVMEKAQDTIIRAHHKGPFMISGPAGSGKTTLALHRIAYLLQAPHTADLYKDQSIIVFVQDQKSKDYFSHILPELGIKSVQIKTFSEWASEIMDLPNVSVVSSYSADLFYEFEKLEQIRKIVDSGRMPNYSEKPFIFLQKIYKTGLSENNQNLFKEQQKKNVLDRIDLTILLLAYRKRYGRLTISREIYDFDSAGDLITKKKRITVDYMLMLVDEFQNYLPEQINIFKDCVNKEYESIIYVGDATQQINPGTRSDLFNLNSEITTDRCVRLQKVYRNTKKIIGYISSLGYQMPTPELVKDGSDVVEKIFSEQESQLAYIKNIVESLEKNKSIGILAVKNESLGPILKIITPTEYVHIMTIRESQGLEFDTVCLVDFDKDNYFDAYKKVPVDFQNEKQKIDRDLLYIGLTRAISDLHLTTIK